MRTEEFKDIEELTAIKDIKQRRLTFLNKTVEFYSNNLRCVNNMGNCFYYPKNGSVGCAIGRFLPDDSNLKLRFGGTILNAFKAGYIIPDWMLEMGIDFLTDIQRLHDDNKSWIPENNKNQLNDYGQNMVGSIVRIYCE